MSWRTVLLLLLLGFAVGSIAFFLVKGGLVGLPTSPFGDSKSEVTLLEEAALAERRMAAKLPRAWATSVLRRGSAQRLELRLHESDLRDLLIAGLSRRPEGRRVLEMTRQARATIEDGEIGFELVVNLSELPRDRLSDKELETVEKLEKLVPLLGRSDLPIGLYGSPEVSNGRIRLGGSPWMRFSILKLSLETVGERLGISPAELESSLEIEWPGFEVLDVRVEGGAVELLVARTA